MKRLLTLVAFFATLQASAQQVNPVPDYVFRNQMSVGRGTVTDTAAYFSIGPRYGANKGFMPPIVGDTATFSSGKRNGLLIFSVQKNKFLYWDSVRVQWSDMAGSSGSYITGSGITGYLPQFSASTTLDTSALFTIGNRLGIGSSTFAYTSTNTANVELNGTAGGILGFKRNDSARGYLWHTGDNMELANTVAGSISFNTNSATRGSISSAGVWRLNNLAGTGDRVVVASSNGTLSASTSVTGLVDTTTISTRAWRQKGLDSLAALEVSGSGTTNYIPKFTAGSTIGNSQIFDNGTNVGIGTASPSAKFTVVGAGAQTILNSGTTADARMEFHYNSGREGFISWDTDNLRLQADAGNYLTFFSNATERLRIFANGRIGINTTTDAGYQLDINGTLRSVNGANFATTSGNVGIGSVTPTSYTNYKTLSIAGATTGAVIDMNTSSGVTAGGFQIAATSTNTDFLAYGPQSGTGSYFTFQTGTYGSISEKMRITASGNVGVGTASPVHTLHLNSSFTTYAHFTNSNSGTTNADGMSIGVDGNDYYLWVRENQPLYIGTNSTSRLLIKADGELLVNTTSDAGDYKLQVSGNIYNTGSAVLAATSGNVGIGGTSPQAKLDVYGAFRVSSATFNIPPSGAGIEYSFRPGDSTGYVLTFSRDYNTYRNQRYFALTHRFSTSNSELDALFINASQETLINTTTDAGDYKLQVSGNALVTAGKLDITTNTAFGLSVSRSGTSVVGGQINNSNGILYYGAESSTGGGLFTGSSAYAAVIGSGAAYPLQFATDNVTRATINTNGELLIATTTDNGDFKLQVNGSALISGSIQTANPVSGTAVPWRLGSVVATNVQLDTANYVEVNINGTFYRLAIVTPL